MSLTKIDVTPSPGASVPDQETQHANAASLLELALLLGQQNDFQEILRLTTAKGLELLKADVVSIVMFNPQSQSTVKTIVNNGKEFDEKHHHLLHRNIIGWVMKYRQPFLSEATATDPRFARDLFAGSTISSAMCVPMQSERMISGHIVVTRQDPGKPFNLDDLDWLGHFAVICAPFLSNAQNLHAYFEAPVPDGALLRKFEVLGLIGKCQKFKELLRAIDSAAKCDVRVFLEGQSGTGKEVVARAIHKLSARSQHPFVAIDCGAIPASLIESELFGHVKGAFTGATQHRKGMIEEADHGTLFMDEIGNLPLEMQAKLLRSLQEQEVRSIGSNQTRKVDVRVVAASGQPVWNLVENKSFREDLYYRLHVYPIAVPRLNERSEDIAMLALHFLNRFTDRQQKALREFHPSLQFFMQHRTWPGNVRELENFVERLVTLAPQAMTVLDASILPQEFQKEFKLLTAAQSSHAPTKPLQESLDRYEAELIQEALVNNNWNQSETARALGISERTMRYKMDRLGIAKPG